MTASAEEEAAMLGAGDGDDGLCIHDDDGQAAAGSGDPELESMKRRIREMEEEASKLREMQAQVERDMEMAGDATGLSPEQVDARSVYVGNVDYGATPEELQKHFEACGTINRITILCDRYTGHPKGYAYVEFADPAHVDTAMALNESLFRNRLLKVISKRTNVPSYMRGGYRGGSAGRRPYRGWRGSYRGGSYRSRRAHFAPY